MFSNIQLTILILCYCQNLNGDYVKHPLFQHVPLLISRFAQIWIFRFLFYVLFLCYVILFLCYFNPQISYFNYFNLND